MRRVCVVLSTLIFVLLCVAVHLPSVSAREEAMWRFPNYSPQDNSDNNNMPNVIPAARLTDDDNNNNANDESALNRFESARADAPKAQSKTKSPSRGCNAKADPCDDPNLPARATIVPYVSSAAGRFTSPYSQSEQEGYQPVDPLNSVSRPPQQQQQQQQGGKKNNKAGKKNNKKNSKKQRAKLPSVNRVSGDELQQLLEKREAKDAATLQLQKQVEGLLKKIQSDKKWLDAVHTIVSHYKTKAQAVEAGIQTEKQGIKALQVAMRRRHQENIRKVLQKKLLESQQQLEAVEQNQGAYSDQRQQVNEIKTRLIHNINQIRRSMNHVTSF